ncbi:ArsR/SmtB family transcription factor [Isobaculum melis]
MMEQLGQETLQHISQMFKVLGDPTRISILYLLKERELSVGNIAKELEMEQSAVSHQLKTLKNMQLVKSRRAGKTVYYSQDDSHVWGLLEQAIEHTLHQNCQP